MARRVRDHDWAATPLGPIDGWPQSLRTIVGLMLASSQPAYIGWGPETTSLYNDGYIPIIGGRHPAALGCPYAQVWPEIWGEYRPSLGADIAGEARHVVDQPVRLADRPARPMSWFTFSWTPIRDESGSVAGFYCVATETTDRVVADGARAHGEAALAESEARCRALTVASAEVVYRMSPDWTEMRLLEGRGFLADAEDPSFARRPRAPGRPSSAPGRRRRCTAAKSATARCSCRSTRALPSTR